MQNKVHLMTQDDQPYGSERRCCERCGSAYWNWPEGDIYVSSQLHFTKETVERDGYIRCGDKSSY